MKTYNCKNCNDEWGFIPEDYRYKKDRYPAECPLCQMPILDAFNDIREYQGLLEAIKFVVKFRILRWK